MIPLEEAQEYVLDAVGRAKSARLPLDVVLGCVTAAPIVARESIPAFDNTAMDGYALRSTDAQRAPVTLHVVDELPAGRAPRLPVGGGEAIQIMTGAPIPPGADAVINVEETERSGDQVTVGRPVPAGQFVRRAGSDVLAGTTVFPAGVELAAAHLGVLASLGERAVEVYPRLRVGVISSGDELVTDGSALLPGQIRESNKDMLLALVEQTNCVAVDLGLARDNKEEIGAALERGVAECDALITSGGVSMGEYDLVRVVLEGLGTMRWMQIAIQPAKPFAFGILGTERPVPVFGLPGNPVSSFVSFELLCRPALRKIMGHHELTRPFVEAITDDGLPRRPGDGKTQWQRVHGTFESDGRLHVRSTGEQGSHQLANSAEANALARIPDSTGIPPGGDVGVLLLVR